MKFARPSKAMTLTLPLDVIDALRAIDDDIARAIVRLARRRAKQSPKEARQVSFIGGRTRLITVPPETSLAHRAGVLLIPTWDGRTIITLDEATTAAEVELRLRDALQDVRLSPNDRVLFQELTALLENGRRGLEARVDRRWIFVVEPRRD